MADVTSSEILSFSHEGRLFPPPPEFQKKAHIRSLEEYRALYDEAAKDPDGFWGARAREELYWKEPFHTVLEWKPPHARWFLGGTTNLCYNAVDRHLAKHGDKTAILFEGEPGDVRKTPRKPPNAPRQSGHRPASRPRPPAPWASKCLPGPPS